MCLKKDKAIQKEESIDNLIAPILLDDRKVSTNKQVDEKAQVSVIVEKMHIKDAKEYFDLESLFNCLTKQAEEKRA